MLRGMSITATTEATAFRPLQLTDCMPAAVPVSGPDSPQQPTGVLLLLAAALAVVEAATAPPPPSVGASVDLTA